MNYEPTNKHKPLVGHGLSSQLLISDLHVYLTTQSSTCQCTREPLAWCRLRGRLIWLLWGHVPETFPTRKKVIQSYYCWWFRNPNNHLGCITTCKHWDIYHMSTGAGFLPSTVSLTYMSTSNYCWIFRDLARHCIFLQKRSNCLLEGSVKQIPSTVWHTRGVFPTPGFISWNSLQAPLHIYPNDSNGTVPSPSTVDKP